MTQPFNFKRLVSATAVPMLVALASAGLLTSCATTSTTDASNNTGFKFWVLRYQPPVDAAAWVPDTALSADPEGAALNIANAMQRGDLQQWLSNWESSDRPQLTQAQTDALLGDWKSLKGAHVAILGRVVAEFDVIVELSVAGSQNQAGKIQIPLKRANDRWWLTSLDPASEYLHWENSPNKIINYVDPDAFQKHLDMIQGGKKAEIAPTKKAPAFVWF